MKSRAEVEATVRAEVEAVADLAGSTVTSWSVTTLRCDVPNPGRRWGMGGSAEIPLPTDKHVATVRAIHDRWFRAGWQFADYRTTPDVSLTDGVTASLAAAHPNAGLNLSVTSRDSRDLLTIGFGTRCFQPAKGEDPASG